MEGVEYIKYSASPKLLVEEWWKGRLYVEVVMVVEVVTVVEVNMVGYSNYNYS